MQLNQTRSDTDPIIIGRQWELALLQRALATAAEGRLTVVSLAGDPGIGKTHLMRHLAWQASRAGLVVLEGSASDAEGMPPYLPFLEALGGHIHASSVQLLAQQSQDTASILGTILPELTVRLGPVTTPYTLAPEQARLRLFEAMGTFLHAISATSGALLVLDDVHWADPSTLELLVHIARRQPRARMLVIASYRTAEGHQSASLKRALTELSRHRVLARLELGPLTRADVKDLTAANLLGPADAMISESLYTRSEGNPFFAEEMLRGWMESSVLVKRYGRWQIAEDRRTELPVSILAAVRERLTRLPPSARHLLTVAALIGRSFTVELLAAAADLSADKVEADLTASVVAGLVQSRDAGYTFTHDTVRETVGADLGETQRRRIHASIAVALESIQHSDPSARAVELAFHYCRAQDPEKGMKYTIVAAQQAEESFAFAEALDRYREALKLLSPQDARRDRLLLQCGQAALHSGHEQEAVDLFSVARKRSQQVGDVLTASEGSRGLALAKWRQGDLHGASIDLSFAISLLQNRAHAHTVRALVDMASLLNAMGRQPEGLTMAQRARDMATALGDERLEAAACRVTGQLTAWGNDIAGGDFILRRALALAVVHDDPAEAAEICGILANISFANFDIAESHRMTIQRLEFAQRSQQPYGMRHIKAWLAELHVQNAAWEEAESLIQEAQPIIDQLEDGEPRAVLCRVRGRLAQYREQLDEAAKWYTEAIALIRPLGAQHLAWHLGPLTCIEMSRGNRTAAHQLMLQLQEVLSSIPLGSLSAAPALTDAVEWCLLAGEPERAAQYAKPLQAFGGRMFLSSVDLTLGRYELTIGNLAAAKTYLDRAEYDARRAGLRTQLLPILLEKSRILDPNRGDGKRGALLESLSLSEEMGLTDRATRIRAELTRFSSDPLPAGLSPREAEVLKLVATGQSNRQIAATLAVSEKTVEHHITHILNKTGTSNRAGATAFAIHHGVV